MLRIYKKYESNVHSQLLLLFPDSTQKRWYQYVHFLDKSDVGKVCEIKPLIKLLFTAYSSI